MKKSASKKFFHRYCIRMQKRLARSDNEDRRFLSELEDLRKSAEVHMEKRVQITIDGSGLESQLEDFMLELLSNIEARIGEKNHAKKDEVTDRKESPGEAENIMVFIKSETNRFKEIFKLVNKCIKNTGKAMKSLRKRLFKHQ